MGDWTGLSTPRFSSTAAGSALSASCSFVVPAISVANSARPSNFLAWVGLDGNGNNTVEQCGIAGFVDPSGAVRYQAWYEFFPADSAWLSPSIYPVSAGDTFTASASVTGGTCTLTNTNVTKGWTASAARTAQALQLINGGVLPQYISAEAIVEADQPENTMADFGTVNFTNVVLAGQTLATSWTQLNQDPAQAVVSNTIQRSGWVDFTVTWQGTR